MSLRKLFEYVGQVDTTYGIASERYWVSTKGLEDIKAVTRCASLDDLLARVTGGCLT